MVIIDASIQMGSKKALCVIGCRSCDLPEGRAPTLQDFEPLALKIVDSLTAQHIEDTLKEVKDKVGHIICICSDRGSDVLKGVRDFLPTSPHTRHIFDTAHFIANQLRSTLEKDSAWPEFRKQVTQARRKLQQSVVAGAMPPSPRSKARFMNMDTLIEWASEKLDILDAQESLVGPKSKEMTVFTEVLHWLGSYRSEINRWQHLVKIGQVAREVVRVEGIHNLVSEAFLDALGQLPTSSEQMAYEGAIHEFLLQQSSSLPFGARLLGTSEPIESMFGKMKSLEREQRCFGFTSLSIATLACVGPIGKEVVKDAMEGVTLAQIDDWSRAQIGESVQKQRKSLKEMAREKSTKNQLNIERIFQGKVVGN